MVEYDTLLVLGCDSRSVIRHWYLACLRRLASCKFSEVLAGTVSSKMRASLPEITTRSGLWDDVDRSDGMVAGGLLLDLRPGRSAYKVSD